MKLTETTCPKCGQPTQTSTDTITKHWDLTPTPACTIFSRHLLATRTVAGYQYPHDWYTPACPPPSTRWQAHHRLTFYPEHHCHQPPALKGTSWHQTTT